MVQEAYNKIQSHIKNIEINEMFIEDVAKEANEKTASLNKKNLAVQDIIHGDNILNVLAWKFEGGTNKFTLLSSDFGYDKLKHISFEEFLGSIKKCYVDYFADVYGDFIDKVNNLENKDRASLALQFFIPVELDFGQKYYGSLYIYPAATTSILFKDFYFVVIPIKKYEDEPIAFKVLMDMKADAMHTRAVKSKFQKVYENILTKEQAEIFKLILRDCNSNEIAAVLSKSYSSVMKFNIRITTILSEYFEMPFPSVCHAASYYKKCFLTT